MSTSGEAFWEVYIIQTVSGKLYTGITTDVERRFKEHSTSSKRAARFFYSSPAEKIVFRESCKNRSDALRRESAIKKMTRKEKLDLIGLCPLYQFSPYISEKTIEKKS